MMSVAIAATATTTASGLPKPVRFQKYGNKKSTTASSTSSVVQRPLSRQTLTAVKILADATPAFPSCSEQFLQGKVLNGKYKIGRMVGKGRYSAVFSGSFEQVEYALKCFNATNDSFFDGEVAALKKLNHANVIKMIDSFEDSSLKFIVTEMCQMDLEKYIEINKKLDFPTAKNIMLQISGAVVYLHDSGTFHRDLKPENILVNSYKNIITVKINDFGLSTAENYSSNVIAGTRLYMSPEIFNHLSGISWAKNDVWALGLIFFNMLTGTYPWEAPMLPGTLISNWKSDYGFTDDVVTFFQKVFTRSKSRPNTKEFQELLAKL